MEKNWNQILLENFAVTIGSSLDELRNEYDDMIKTFELQVRNLKNFLLIKKRQAKWMVGLKD